MVERFLSNFLSVIDALRRILGLVSRPKPVPVPVRRGEGRGSRSRYLSELQGSHDGMKPRWLRH